MTKAELVEEIAKRTGMTKPETAGMVEAFMDTVKETMVAGESVYLRGFGSFMVKERAKKKARDIGKNTTIEISAHNVPAFKACKAFKEAIRRSK